MRRLTPVLLAALIAGCSDKPPGRVVAIDQTGVVRGTAYVDRDGDGAFGSADAPAAGVSISILLDATGAVVGIASTAADGTFLMPEIDIGRYRISATRGALGDTVDVQTIASPIFSLTAGDTVTREIRLGYPVISVQEARARSSGSRVIINGVALNTWSAFGDSTVHVGDATGAVRAVRLPQSTIQQGDGVRLLGVTGTQNGNFVIADATLTLEAPAVGLPAADSVSTQAASTAGSGTLAYEQVRISGAIIQDTVRQGTDLVLGVNDGSGRLEIVLDNQVPFDGGGPYVPGATFSGSGVLVPLINGTAWRLKPRGVTEATTYFDAITIEDARSAVVGNRVVIEGVTLNNWSAFGDSTVHMRDHTGYIRAVRVLSPVGAGDSIRMVGTVATRDGQPVLTNVTPSVIRTGVGIATPDSIGTGTASAGGSGQFDAALVRVGGTIESVQTQLNGDIVIEMDDGTGMLEVLLDQALSFNITQYQPGSVLSATGVLVPADGGVWQLKPRFPLEAITTFEAITIAQARGTAPGELVVIEGVALNSWTAFGDSTVHLQDATGNIRAARVLGPVTAGDRVRLVGTVAQQDNQPILFGVSPTLLQAAVGVPAPDSMATADAASAAAGTLDAGQARVRGTITAVQSLTGGDVLLNVNDGSGVVQVLLDGSIAFTFAQYQAGAILNTAGVLVPSGNEWRLKPRSPFEATISFQPITIANARAVGVGQLVVVEAIALNNWSSFADSTVHLQDASGSIRAVRVLAPVAAGDRVRMIGTMATRDGQPVINLATPTVVQAGVGIAPPDSISTAAAAGASGSRDASLVRVSGTISTVQTVTGGNVAINMSDGTGTLQVLLDADIAFTHAQYQPGAVLHATGVLVSAGGGVWVLKPRTPPDATISFNAITIADARTRPSGELIVIEGVALNNWASFGDSTVHIQDATGNLRAVRVLSNVAAGDRIRLIGTTSTRDGQPVIALATPTVLQAGVGVATPDSISTSVAALANGGQLDAAQVRIAGPISLVQTLPNGDRLVQVSDGSGPIQVLLDAGIAFNVAQYQPGAILRARGVLVPAVGGGSWQLKPRTQADALATFEPITIAQARALPVGQLVVIEGVALNALTVFGDSTVHVEDASSSIRAVRVIPQAQGNQVQAGNRLRLVGTTATRDGQRVIDLVTTTVLQEIVDLSDPDSITTATAASAEGGSRDAGHVTIGGTISTTQTLANGDMLLTVNDDSGPVGVLLDANVAFTLAQYQPGAQLRAVGVLVPAGSSWRIKPRNAAEATISFEAIPIAQARGTATGNLVVIEGVALNSWPAFGDSTVHIEDASGTVRAIRVLANVDAGSRVRLIGTMATRDGQPVIELATPTLLEAGVGTSTPDSISTGAAVNANGGTRDAEHVRIAGEIVSTQQQSGELLIDVNDGSGALRVVLDASLPFNFALYQPGGSLNATGVLVPVGGGVWRLKPRSAAEATVTFDPISIAAARATAVGQLVVIEGVALNNWTAFADSTVHIKDPSGYIRATRVLSPVSAGDSIRLIGTIATQDGQPVVNLPTAAVLQASVGFAAPDSVSTSVAASASSGSIDAAHVRIAAPISAVQTLPTGDRLIDVNDGSGLLQVRLDAQVAFNVAQYQPGAILRATGVLVPTGGAVWQLKPRAPVEAIAVFEPITIAQARTAPVGQLVVIEGAALNGLTVFGDSTLHVEDASGTIRATRVIPQAQGNQVQAGNRLRLVGTTAVRDGQRVIDLVTTTVLQEIVNLSTPDSITTAVAATASGGTLDAAHVVVGGTISARETLTNGDVQLTVSDGSGAVNVVLDANVVFTLSLYQPGASLRAVGVLVPSGGSWRVKPRSPTEALISFMPITIAQARAEANGALVVIEGVALNNWTAFGDSTVHIEDASGTIRAVRVLADVGAGNRIRLIGTRTVRDGQPVIDLASPSLLQQGVGIGTPDSVSTAIAASAATGSIDATQVRIAGAISAVQTLPSGDRLIDVNDGSGVLQVRLDAGIPFNIAQYQAGAILRATGVLIPTGGAVWQLRPRTPTEALATFEPITIAQARSAPTGQLVVIEGAALNALTVFGDSTLHVEDASGYIRATRVIPQAQGNQVQAGNRLRLVGTTALRDGQRVIDLVTTTVLQEVVNLSTPDSIATSIAATASGGALDAAHVIVGGTISTTQTLPNGDVLLTVNDGSGAVIIVLDANIAFSVSQYQPGADLRAIGTLVPSGPGNPWRVKPRSPAEATISFEAITIAQARAAGTGTLVVVEGVALNNWSAFGDSTVHIEDASGTIRAVRVLADVGAGNRIRLIGTTTTRDGQPVIELATPTLLQAGVGLSTPDSVSTAAAASASGGSDARHVRVVGNITATQTQAGELWVDINDGSGSLRVVLDASLPFNHAQFQVGGRLNVTGVLVPVGGGVWRLKPRSTSETAVTFHPIPIATARNTPIGQLVVIEGIALNNWLAFGDSTVHLRDPSGYIRAMRVLAPVAAGDSIRLIGTMATRDAQPVVNLATPTLLQQGVGVGTPDSLATGVAASANGGALDAAHARIAAPISSVQVLGTGDRIVNVNDGSGLLEVWLDQSIAFNVAQYQPGAILRATGVLVPTDEGGWQLQPRAPAEAIATFEPITIVQARSAPIGQLVVIEGAALNGLTVFGDSTLHIEDATGRIRAVRVIPQAQGNQVQAGNRLRLVGTVATRDGQRVIDLVTTTVLQEIVNLSTADSISTATAATASGGTLDAAHVTVGGTISSMLTLPNNDVRLTVNDGSGNVDVVLDANITFTLSQYQPGALLRAVGVLVPSGGSWRVKPRSPVDATVSFSAITIAAARAADPDSLVVIEGIALNNWTAFGDSTVHMQDASGTIRAVRVLSTVAAGDRIRLIGTTDTRDGQPVVTLGTPTVIQAGVGVAAPDSVSTAMAASANGGLLDADQVTIGGTISSVQTIAGGDVLVTVTDGTGALGVLVDASLGLSAGQFTAGAVLRASGVLVPSGTSWRLKPRTPAEASTSFQPITLAQARLAPNGTLVVVEGVALNNWSAFGDSTVHLEDATGTIRATRVLAATPAEVSAGNRILLIGTKITQAGQPVIDFATPTLDQAGVGTSSPDSISTAAAAAASSGRDADHVRIVGNIIATQTQFGDLWIDVNDGSGELRVVLDVSLPFNHALYQPGALLDATGVLVPVGGGLWRLKPRAPAEATVSYHPIPIAAARTTPVGQLVVVEGVALNNWMAFGDSTVHLRDPSGYIRATRVLQAVAAGDSIRLVGTIATGDGQTVINQATPTTLQAGVGLAVPDSVSTSVAASANGGALDAADVRIAAAISTVDLLPPNNDRLVTVSDGSGVLQVLLDASIAFNVTDLKPGAILRARGVLVPVVGGGGIWQLKPRFPTEAIATFEPITIAEARTGPLGRLVVIEGAALNGFPVFGDSTVHVEDASGTIRATRVLPQAQGNQVQAGNRLRLVGLTATRDGQRVIDLVTTTVLEEVVNLSTPDSITTALAATADGGLRDAEHVVVGGPISITQTLPNGDVLLTVNDGSGAVVVLLDANIAFTLAQYQPGAQVRAVGVLVPSGGAWRVKPRSSAEATISFEAITISQARAAAVGNLVVVEGVALNNWSAFGDSTVHVEDATGTIRGVRVLADVAAGSRVRLIGTRSTRDGQAVIDLATPTLLESSVGTSTPDSVSTFVAATAASGDADHVRVVGNISATQLQGGELWIDINDGSGPLRVVLDPSLPFSHALYKPGGRLDATGVLVPVAGGGFRLKPRSPAEATVSFHPISIAAARGTAVGQLVVIEGVALNNWTAFGDSTVHLRDPSGYIRAMRVDSAVAAGDSIRLIGTVATQDGQRVINPAARTLLLPGVGFAAPDSVATSIAATANGGLLDAAHVRIRAPISAVDVLPSGDRIVTVNDGSGVLQVHLDAAIAFNVAQYQPGAILRANGVLVPIVGGGSWQLKPRATGEAIATFEPITIAQARTAPLNQLVVIEGAALNGFTVFNDSTVHVEDATGQIRATRVIPQQGGGAQVQAGNRLRLVGTTALRDGQRVIDLVTTTVLQEVVNLSTPDSISTAAAANAGTALDAAHRFVHGSISTTAQLGNGDVLLTVNDGSGPVGVVLDANIAFNLAMYQPGADLRVTGVLVPSGSVWRLKPRSPTEALTSFQPITIAQARTTPVGQLVVIEGIALNAWSAFGDATVHMHDATDDIRVMGVAQPATVFEAGDSIRIIGLAAQSGGQPVINSSTSTLILAAVGAPLPDSVSTLIAANAGGGSRDASIVKIGGTIEGNEAVPGGDRLIRVNDGSGLLEVILDAQIGFNQADFQVGALLRATGVLVPQGGGVWRLKPRSLGDAFPTYPTVSITQAKALGVGQTVFIEGVALNGRATFGDQTVHVVDASGNTAIRTINVPNVTMFAGDSIRILGTVAIVNTQKVLNVTAGTAAVLLTNVGMPSIDSVTTGVAAAAQGGVRDANQVAVSGTILAVTPGQGGEVSLTISDGSGNLVVVLDPDVGIATGSFAVGQFVRVRGVLIPAVGGTTWELKPRLAAEVVTITPAAGPSNVSAAPLSVTANGTATSTVTVTVRDGGNNPMVGLLNAAFGITLTGNAQRSAVTASGTPGVYTFTVRDTAAQNVVVTVTVSGISLSQQPAITFTPGPPTAATSNVGAAPLNIVAGTTPSTVTVTVRDQFNNPVAGLGAGAFEITASGAAQESPIQQTTPGVYTFTVSDTVAENVTVAVTVSDVVLGPPPAITFTTAPPAAATSNVSASPDTLSAGVALAVVTTTVRDQYNNPITGRTSTDFEITVSGAAQRSAITESGTPGVYTFTMSNTVAEDVTVTIAVNGIGLTPQPVVITFNPAAPAPAASNAMALPTSLVAGSGPSTVTVAVRDQYSNPIPGLSDNAFDIVVTGSADSSAVVPTATPGNYMFTVTDTVAEVVTATIFVNNVQLTQQPVITFTGGAPVAAMSDVAAAPDTVAAGDASTVTVTVHDQYDNPVTGLDDAAFDILLTPLAERGTVIASPATPGVYTFTVTDTVPRNVTVAVTVSSVALTPQPTLTFTTGAPGAATSTVAAAPTGVLADGVTASTVTVTVRDPFNNLITELTDAAFTVGLTGDAADGDVIETATPGVYTFAVTDTVAEEVTVTVAVNGVTLTQQASITFVLGGPSAAMSDVVAEPDTLAVGESSTVTVTVSDQFTNPIADLLDEAFDVVLTGAATRTAVTATVTPGEYTFTVTDTVAEDVTVTVTVDEVSLTQQPVITFNPGPVVLANSTFTVPSGAAGSVTNVSITLRDAMNNPVPGQAAELAVTVTGDNTATASIVDNGNGVYTASYTPANPGTDNIAITFSTTAVPDSPFTSVVNIGPPSATESTVTATPTNGVIANGTDASTVTVTVRDQAGNPISGVQPNEFSIFLTNNAQASPVAPTGVEGEYTFTVTNENAGPVTIELAVKTVPLEDEQVITFIPGPPGPAASTVVASPDSLVANGTSESVVTVTVLDAFNNPITGLTLNEFVVALAEVGGSIPVSAEVIDFVADGTPGVYHFGITNDEPETVTVTVTVNEVVLDDQPEITFTSGAPSPGSSSVTAVPSSVAADGVTQSLVTITVRDEFDIPIAGLTADDFVIGYTGSAAGTVVSTALTADAQPGVYFFNLTNTVAGTVNVNVNVLAVALNSPTVTFTP